ncbi:MAG: VCBS repeat-containing protein, partial [Fuerstiella sp.]|nr:VCBS repeat-containing protein [Fuerstiella sp.]
MVILVMASAASLSAQKVKFRTHVLNAQSQFSAGAVFDVNHDGKLDVFSGGFWYEAPHWKKHTVREVEMIGDRYDDYSNLPLDVNGDGWTDVISVNYRSQSLYWVEHPGKSLGVWKKHIIDKPGASETGRLVDVDGDGQLDVLPNGMKYAAWYSWNVQRKVDGTNETHWQRHDLPQQIAGHGIGFGDVNGDGRSDLIGS